MDLKKLAKTKATLGRRATPAAANSNSASSLKQLPAALAADVVSSVDNTKVKTDWRNLNSNYVADSLFRFEHNLIVNVEILAGYAGAKEEWTLLTSDVLTKMGENDKCLCRLRAYQNSDLNICRYEGLELPIFDEYFVLVGDNLQKSSAEITAAATKTIENKAAIQQMAAETIYQVKRKVDMMTESSLEGSAKESLSGIRSEALVKAKERAKKEAVTKTLKTKISIAPLTTKTIAKKKSIKNIGR